VRGPRRYLVELVGTLVLTLTLLGAASQDVLLGALALGAVVALLVHVGGHANPVLTLAAVVARRTPAAELLPCWAAQFVGALLAAALGRWLVEAPAVSPLQDVGVVTLLVVEALFAFALCFVVLDGERGESLAVPNGGAALAAGLTVVAAAALLDPVGASAFNPAAAFGQVVAGISEWGTIWVYLVTCPVGGALAGLAAGQPSSRPG
jgi:glycerol uptake facilitator-like aquaporin